MDVKETKELSDRLAQWARYDTCMSTYRPLPAANETERLADKIHSLKHRRDNPLGIRYL